MTAEEAQALHARITAANGWVMWFVVGWPFGAFAAQAIVADPGSGHQEGTDLIAGTLAELRAMLPAGLTRWERTMMPRDVVETWD